VAKNFARFPKNGQIRDLLELELKSGATLLFGEQK